MKVFVVDTHVLVWWLEANPKLPLSVQKLLDDTDTDLHLPAIVVLELVDLCLKGRTALTLDPVLALLRDESRFVVLDLTAELVFLTAKCASLPDIHDRCIVATTAKLREMQRDTVLITRDQAIRKSGLVPTMWD